MKKIIILAVAIGLTMIAAGWFMIWLGGEDIDDALDLNSDTGIKFFGIDEDSNGDIDLGFDTDAEFFLTGEHEVIEKSFENVEEIELELGIYDVEIFKDDDVSEVEIYAKKPIIEIGGEDYDKLAIEMAGKTLTIKQNRDHSYLLSLDDSKRKGELIIKIPNDHKIKEISVDNGVGEVNLTETNLDTADIDVGVGVVYIKESEIAELEIASGTGDIKLENMLTEEADLESGTGDVEFLGNSTKKLDIDSGVGNIDLDLYETEDYYSFNINSGLGDINLNGEKSKGSIKANSEKNSELSLQTGLGDIRITTE